MSIWPIVFFPAPGEKLSPYDYIKNLSDNERGQIIHRLDIMQKHEIGDWPKTWIHKIEGDIFQLTAGDHRVMYCLHNRKIVVIHACRKVKQKTHKKDIRRAKIHYNEYISAMKG